MCSVHYTAERDHLQHGTLLPLSGVPSLQSLGRWQVSNLCPHEWPDPGFSSGMLPRASHYLHWLVIDPQCILVLSLPHVHSHPCDAKENWTDKTRLPFSALSASWSSFNARMPIEGAFDSSLGSSCTLWPVCGYAAWCDILGVVTHSSHIHHSNFLWIVPQ